MKTNPHRKLSQAGNSGSRTVIGIIFGIAAFLAANYAVREFLAPNVPAEIRDNPAFQEVMSEMQKSEQELNNAGSIEEALEIAAAAARKTLPTKVDEITELIDVQAGPGRKFTYTYRILGGVADDLDPDEFVANARPNLEAAYRSGVLKGFREQAVVVTYRYQNDAGTLIAEIVIGL